THVPFEHVGDGLEAAVRVRREAGDVVVGILRAELVEHQVGIEALQVGAADDPGQAHAGAVRGRLTGMDGENGSQLGHGTPPEWECRHVSAGKSIDAWKMSVTNI